MGLKRVKRKGMKALMTPSDAMKSTSCSGCQAILKRIADLPHVYCHLTCNCGQCWIAEAVRGKDK